MLKTELERRLKEAEAKADDLSNDRIRIMREGKEKDDKIETLEQQLNYNADQLYQIKHSIHTILQVKYPDTYADNNIKVEDSEDKRF